MLPMNLPVQLARKAFRVNGFDLIHYAPWKKLFESFQIDLILDIGANIGQSYDSFRWAGYQGPICSFEPNPETFGRLKEKKGKQWQRLQCALSNRAGELKFYIDTSNDNDCSLQAPVHKPAKIVRETHVPAWRLDELWSREGFKAKSVFLKIDAEGHDLEIIKGATGIMDRISLIMAEVCPLSRYEGEPPMHEFLNYMAGMDFRICRVDKNAIRRAAGIDIALDMVFARHEALVKIGF